MKHHLGNFIWIAVTGLVAAGLLFILMPQPPDNAGLKTVADARQSLREQGFKTDLADFDFSTTTELRAREAILKATTPDYRSEPFRRPSEPHGNRGKQLRDCRLETGFAETRISIVAGQQRHAHLGGIS